MSNILSADQNNYQSVIDFLNRELRADNNWSIASEYPIAFSKNNLKNIRFIYENNEIVAHAVLKHLIIKTPSAILKVAGIGSVVTKEEYRHRGYSTQIIKNCLEQASAEDADVAILWTNLFDFYRKFGFELAGSEIALVIEDNYDAPLTNLKFLNDNKVSAEAISKIYSQHTVSTFRTPEEISKYLQIPNSTVYTAWDQNNQLQAYAIEGRGADLTNYIHEWGGNVPALMSLFANIRKTKNTAITVISPAHSYNLITEMIKVGAMANDGYLGMIKIVNFKNLFFKIIRYSRNIGIEDFVIEQIENGFRVGCKNKTYHIKSENDMVKLIFGPHKASELGDFDKETLYSLEKIFPLPLWVWGWDSV